MAAGRSRAADAATRSLRTALLRAAESERVGRFVSRHGMRLGARRFVPAETIDEAVPVFRALARDSLRGLSGLFDDPAFEAEAVRRHEEEYAGQLARFGDEGLDVEVGLKITHLGVHVDPDLLFAAVGRLLDAAGDRGRRVWIDMEESVLVDPTLDLHRRLRGSGRDNVGVVVQSYLRRASADLERLLPDVDVRIVKGAYLEPPDVAFTDKRDVDDAYLRLLERGLGTARRLAIATHDERIVERATALIRARAVPPERYEFQLLHGVRADLARRLASAGHPVRIAAPYGPTWFPYLMRRLAERPANVAFLLRGAARR